MLEIPGIDADKVERYGKRFLKLIQTAQHGYKTMKHEEDRPQDPNHQNVVTLISSDDDEFADDGGLDDFIGSEGSQEERSSYFQPAPEVDAFNARCKSSLAAKVPVQPPNGRRTSQSPKPRPHRPLTPGRHRTTRAATPAKVGAEDPAAAVALEGNLGKRRREGMGQADRRQKLRRATSRSLPDRAATILVENLPQEVVAAAEG